MKKADISINTIIVAVIAIIVLVVLVLIFTGRFKDFSFTTSDCQSNFDGQCLPEGTCLGRAVGRQSCDSGWVCCVTEG